MRVARSLEVSVESMGFLDLPAPAFLEFGVAAAAGGAGGGRGSWEPRAGAAAVAAVAATWLPFIVGASFVAGAGEPLFAAEGAAAVAEDMMNDRYGCLSRPRASQT